AALPRFSPRPRGYSAAPARGPSSAPWVPVPFPSRQGRTLLAIWLWSCPALRGCMSLEPSFFFSSRRRHTRCYRDWSSDVCSSDLDDGSTVIRLHHVQRAHRI